MIMDNLWDDIRHDVRRGISGIVPSDVDMFGIYMQIAHCQSEAHLVDMKFITLIQIYVFQRPESPISPGGFQIHYERAITDVDPTIAVVTVRQLALPLPPIEPNRHPIRW